ncbi:MAG: molybdopterin-dependent oxidoreductase [Pikeienuella sp.]
MLLVDATAVSGGVTEFSRADIKEFDQISYRTATEFTDGTPLFSGPLVRDVLKAIDAPDASVAVMTAANDYAIEIPISDFQDYDVILATSVDGKRLSLRDKGPIWVMYPLDKHTKLQDPLYNSRLIWQIIRIDLK